MPEPPRPPQRSDSTVEASELLVLAALQRALLHQHPPRDGVPLWTLLEHLQLPRRSGAARGVRATLAALAERGELTGERRGGVAVWTLTARGTQRLRRARGRGEHAELPESPQHRAWRNARVTAAQELDRFRARALELSQRLRLLLEQSPPPHSDAWLVLGEELERACRRLASASHCLYEWAEPDDEHADVDERSEAADEGLDERARARFRALRAGRRNVRLWGEDAPL